MTASQQTGSRGIALRDGIPEGWSVRALSDLAEIQTGIAKGKPATGAIAEVPYLRVANVQDGHLDLSEVKSIVVEPAALERYRLRPGDVLFTEGGDFDKLGRGCVWRGEIEPCLHQNHVFAVRSLGGVLPEFLAAFAACRWGRAYFLHCAKRTTNLASINSTQLKAFPVPVPPLDEQRQIVATLRAADDAITAGEAVVQQLARVRRDLIEDLLRRGLPRSARDPGPPTSSTHPALGTTPSGWRIVRLGEVLDRIEAGWSPDCEARPAATNEWGVLKVSAVSSGRFRPQENKALPASQAPRPPLEVKVGDVLVARASGVVDLVGVASIVRDTRPRLMLSDKTLRLVPRGDVLQPEFLQLLLGWTAVRTQLLEAATGSHMRNISQAALHALWVAVPDMEDQWVIATAARACSDRFEAECSHVDQLVSLKAALADALLSGRLRVRDAA